MDTDERPSAPPPPKKRARTFAGRLARALRRQDWTAVVVEVVIVVLGIVIGFQITAWGQARADRRTEQTYLRQLAADLRETEWRIAEVDTFDAASAAAADRIISVFYDPAPVPRDSLLVWIGRSGDRSSVQPITGAADALIATGDLRLISDDELRSTITAYLGEVQAFEKAQDTQNALWDLSVQRREREVDTFEGWAASMPRPLLDSLLADVLGKPYDALVIRRPLEVDAFRSNDEMRAVAMDMADAMDLLGALREGLQAATLDLLDLVEASIDE